MLQMFPTIWIWMLAFIETKHLYFILNISIFVHMLDMPDTTCECKEYLSSLHKEFP